MEKGRDKSLLHGAGSQWIVALKPSHIIPTLPLIIHPHVFRSSTMDLNCRPIGITLRGGHVSAFAIEAAP